MDGLEARNLFSFFLQKAYGNFYNNITGTNFSVTMSFLVLLGETFPQDNIIPCLKLEGKIK